MILRQPEAMSRGLLRGPVNARPRLTRLRRKYTRRRALRIYNSFEAFSINITPSLFSWYLFELHTSSALSEHNCNSRILRHVPTLLFRELHLGHIQLSKPRQRSPRDTNISIRLYTRIVTPGSLYFEPQHARLPVRISACETHQLDIYFECSQARLIIHCLSLSRHWYHKNI
jgi:hypothetical protein